MRTDGAELFGWHTRTSMRTFACRFTSGVHMTFLTESLRTLKPMLTSNCDAIFKITILSPIDCAICAVVVPIDQRLWIALLELLDHVLEIHVCLIRVQCSQLLVCV